MSPSRQAPRSSLSDTWMAKNRTFATVLADPDNSDEVSLSWRSASSSSSAAFDEREQPVDRECRVPLHHELRRRWERAASIATGRDAPDVGADYGTYCAQDIRRNHHHHHHHRGNSGAGTSTSTDTGDGGVGGNGGGQGGESEVDRVLAWWYREIVLRHCCGGGGGNKEKGGVGDGNGNGRHYHTLVHLEEMFGYLDLLTDPNGSGDVGDDDASSSSSSSSSPSEAEAGAGRDASNGDGSGNEPLQDLAVVTFATFFHDAVYDPRSTTNEVDSAELYLTFYEEVAAAIERDIENEASSERPQPHEGSGSNADVKRSWTERFDHDRVMRFVIETSRHDVSASPDGLLRKFVDADMSVLAKEPGAYDVYAGLIRREYIHVEREVYCAKRAEVLASFLENERPIFACEAMREAGLEDRARENVKREVQLLKEGVIPGECE